MTRVEKEVCGMGEGAGGGGGRGRTSAHESARIVAQVENEPAYTLPHEAVDSLMHILRGRCVELGEADVADGLPSNRQAARDN